MGWSEPWLGTLVRKYMISHQTNVLLSPTTITSQTNHTRTKHCNNFSSINDRFFLVAERFNWSYRTEGASIARTAENRENLLPLCYVLPSRRVKVLWWFHVQQGAILFPVTHIMFVQGRTSSPQSKAGTGQCLSPKVQTSNFYRRIGQNLVKTVTSVLIRNFSSRQTNVTVISLI